MNKQSTQATELAAFIDNVFDYLLNNIESVKSADRERIEATVEGKKLIVARSHSFLDGEKRTFQVAVDDAPIWGAEYNYLPKGYDKVINSGFSRVGEAVWSFNDRRKEQNTSWLLNKFGSSI